MDRLKCLLVTVVVYNAALTAMQSSAVAHPVTSSPITEKIENMMAQAVRDNIFYGNLDKLQVISAGDGRMVAEMVIEQKHTNTHGTLHGGCIATIIDVCSSIALGTNSKPGMGVSVDIYISYLNPGKLNDTIVIESDTIKLGRSLAFAETTIKSKSTGVVIAKGSHTKFVDNSLGKYSGFDFTN